MEKETLLSDVDVRRLTAAGTKLAGVGIPRFPLIVGGSGMAGSNLAVLLASTPGVEKVRIIDRLPPRDAVQADCPKLIEKLDFRKHSLGTDSEESLMQALEGIDCIFCMVTPDVQNATTEQFHHTNVGGLKLLLKVAIAQHVARFVFMSSIAVTNHFEHSCNMSEADPLPDFDTLWSPYDITKRIGEDMVLKANGQNGMVTCALRASGILLSPTDYTWRNYFMIPGLLLNIGHLRTIDFIYGTDVVRGMLLAAKALDTRKGETAGQAFFVTKGEGCEPANLCRIAGELFNWPMVDLPDILFDLGRASQWFIWELKGKLGLPRPGVPPHKFWVMGRVEQTFNNDKAKRILGYTPEVTVREAVKYICGCHARDLEKGWIKPMPWLGYFRFVTNGAFWLFLVTSSIMYFLFK